MNSRVYRLRRIRVQDARTVRVRHCFSRLSCPAVNEPGVVCVRCSVYNVRRILYYIRLLCVCVCVCVHACLRGKTGKSLRRLRRTGTRWGGVGRAAACCGRRVSLPAAVAAAAQQSRGN